MRRLLLLTLLGMGLYAHEVRYVVSETNATQIFITYGDGAPFDYEPYTIYAPDQTVPFQSGYTAKDGSIVFVPNSSGVWRITAASEDGHGATISYTHSLSSVQAPQTHTRLDRLLLGVGIVLALFGTWALFFSRKSK